MKLIIVEGPDNCGKDTLISKLANHYNNDVVVLHAVKPETDNLFDHYYNGIIHDTLDAFYKNNHKAIIHNRSMYGEYVYGTKYRNKSKEEIKELINKLEVGQLKSFLLNSELYLVVLNSSNELLLLNNDDGLSISNNLSDIKDEINLFNEVYDLSLIKNKKLVYVNNKDKFIDSDKIYKDVLDFINEQ